MAAFNFGKLRLSEEARTLLNLFLPLYAIHCMEQIYFIYGNVVQRYGHSPEETGWVLSIFFVAIMAIRPIGGWLLENFGIRRTLVLASAVGLAGCTLLFFARGIPLIVVGRLLSGASFGAYSFAIFSYQSLIVPKKMRGAAFAIIVSGSILPLATVTPLGEWLLSRSHTNLYLAIGPLMCAVCWYLGSRVGSPAVKIRKEGEAWGTYGELAGSRPFVLLAATGMVIALVDAATVSMSLYAAEKGVVASYFLASSAAVAVIVRVAGARALNALPRTVMLAPCGMLMAGALLLVSILPSDVAFVVAGALFGAGIGSAFPILLALVSDTLPAMLRPKGNATALVLYDSGWFVTPLVVGYTTRLLGIAWTFRILSLAAFAALLALQLLYWIPRHRAARSGEGACEDDEA